MKTKIIFLMLVLASALPLGAQTFQGSFFMDNYRLGFRYNPALTPDTGFISVGDMMSYTANNVGVSAFLYPRDGHLVTGLHSSVSSDEFMSSLKDINTLQSNMSYSLFSYGFAAGGAFHTIEVGARGKSRLSVPKDYFRFLKDGGQDLFSFSGTRMEGRLYTELAYGYSRKIGDKLKLGARAKLLMGLYAADYSFERFDLQVSEEIISADIETRLDMTNRMVSFGVEDGEIQFWDWQAPDDWLPAGAGLALDFGLVWEPFDGFRIAAAVTDLGGLLWSYGNAAYSKDSFTFAGFNDITYNEMNVKDMFGRLKDMTKEVNDAAPLMARDRRLAIERLPFNANAGIRWRMPFYRALSAGFTGNYTAYDGMPYLEGRFAVDVTPLDWLDVCTSVGTGTNGLFWDVAAQLRLYRFRLNFGLQNGLGGTIPDWNDMPLTANAKAFVLGLTYDL